MSIDAFGTLGKYLIRRIIRRSGSTAAYALDPAIARRVAIKAVAMRGGDSDRAADVARLRREAHSAGRLAHPGTDLHPPTPSPRRCVAPGPAPTS